ncbi:glutathione S-transferase C-terminal domain-containing protein [Streptomyces sp. NPDC096205]|uniref:glutathione S-transferase C-terminal domain-containing protein n=1 Tax=Streptomyces sp. NPDC096205 TaxID=3366081 RepID=UPI003819DF73
MSVAPLATRPLPPLRGRIGPDARSGHYAVPRRYRLYLSTACPDGLRLAVTHALLGLDAVLPVTHLPAVPDLPDGGHSRLLPLYEASAHHHPGPAAAPVLADDWSGRVVSTHVQDIMRDLARCFGAGRPSLYPCGAEAEIEAVRRLCARVRHGEPEAALEELEERLGRSEYLVGSHITAADVELWVTLVQLGTPERPALAAYVRRLSAHPAFSRRLDRG